MDKVIPAIAKVESCRSQWPKCHEAEWLSQSFVTKPKWGTL